MFSWMSPCKYFFCASPSLLTNNASSAQGGAYCSIKLNFYDNSANHPSRPDTRPMVHNPCEGIGVAS